MKKFFVPTFILFLILKLPNAYGAEIKFGEINKTEGKPLMEALSGRKTSRSFSNKAIDNDILGKILWVAGGINRDNGKKTVPLARNKNDISIYVLRNDGVWLYNPKKNLIKQINNDGIKEKGIIKLAFVSNSSSYVENGFAYLHAGSMYQNVALFCASEGLGNVVKASFDKKDLAAKLMLGKDDSILITQIIGWVK
jgi:hypothetical protein